MKDLPLTSYSMEFEAHDYDSAFYERAGFINPEVLSLSTEIRLSILHTVSTRDSVRVLGRYYGGYIVLRRDNRTQVVTIAYFKNIIEATNHIRTFEDVSKELDKVFRKLIKEENARRF
jgi:hypothetical protein